MKVKMIIPAMAVLATAIACNSKEAPEIAEQTLEVCCPEPATSTCPEPATSTCPEPASRICPEMSTRISLDTAGRSVWNAGDAVSVFYRTSANEKWFYRGEDGAASGMLKYTGDRGANEFDGIFALYPYSAASALTSQGQVSATLPAAQSRAKGSYDPGAALLAARASGDRLCFTYLTGFVTFTLTAPSDTAVKSVRVEALDSAPLAGAAVIDYSAARPALSLKGTETAVSVDAAEEYDGTTWFAIAPGTYASGFRFTVSYVDGTSSVYAWSDTVKLAAGHVKPYKFTKR